MGCSKMLLVADSYDFLKILAAILFGIVVSYTDLKERSVYDLHAFIAGIAGVGLTLLQYYEYRDFTLLKAYIIMFAIASIVGVALNKISMMADGDVIVLSALSLLLPVKTLVEKGYSPVDTAVGIMLNSMILALPFLLMYGALRVVINRSKIPPVLLNEVSQRTRGFVSKAVMSNYEPALIITTLTPFLLSIFKEKAGGFAVILLFVTYFLLGSLKKRTKAARVVLIASALALAGYRIYSGKTTAQALFTVFVKSWLFLVVLDAAFTLLPVFGKIAFTTLKKVDELTELDIPSIVLLKNKRNDRIVPIFVTNMIDMIYYSVANYLNTNPVLKAAVLKKFLPDEDPNNYEFVFVPRAEGMSGEEISLFRELAKEGVIPNTVLVEDTLPFAPLIWLGFVSVVLVGNLYAALIAVLNSLVPSL